MASFMITTGFMIRNRQKVSGIGGFALSQCVC